MLERSPSSSFPVVTMCGGKADCNSRTQTKPNQNQFHSVYLSGTPISSTLKFSSNQSEHNGWLRCSYNSRGRDRNRRDGVVYNRCCSPTDCVFILKGWQRNSGDGCCQVPLMVANVCWRSWFWTLCHLLIGSCRQLFGTKPANQNCVLPKLTSYMYFFKLLEFQAKVPVWAWEHYKTCLVCHLQVLLLETTCSESCVLTPEPLVQDWKGWLWFKNIFYKATEKRKKTKTLQSSLWQ